jgi:hypothetical protein
MKDLLRANLIKETLEQQKEIPKTIQELRALKARKATAEQRKKLRAIEDERQKMRNWVGTGWDAAYDCASMMLQGTDAHAGAPAMKATYLKVIKNNRKQPLRYYVLGSKIERRLGINCDFPRQVKKRVPFYDLTL